MQSFYLIVNWVGAFALLGLGLAALLKSRKLILNKVFALFTVTISIWIIASYISNDVANSSQVSVIGNYFVFVFSYISGYLLLWFAIALANDKKAAGRLRHLTIPILLVGATTCTPLVVAGAHPQGDVYAVEFGPLAALYAIVLIALLFSALRVLQKNIKISTGHQKDHLVVLFRSMAIALPILLLTEFILPAITGWFGLTNVGILAMVVPVFALYYSVVKLRLFNLRIVIVRSLAYVLTIGIIGAAYSIVSYYLTTLITKANNHVVQEELNVALIIIAISVYPPIIGTFRKLTNRLFYQDAYDAQELFDKLNQVLVSTLDLHQLLALSSKTVSEVMKLDFGAFILKQTSYKSQRIIGNNTKNFDHSELAKLEKLLAAQSRTIIAEDMLEDADADLRKSLEANNISVVVHLSPDAHEKVHSLGYMILGNKKSGSQYTTQDIRVVETIANELIIAMQNALHYEEIQQFNITLQQRIDEATAQLRRTNAKLKTLDETKDDFISMASHQLRTPLTSVKGYLSMVLEGDAGKLTPMQRKMLDQAFVSSQRMVFLIADLLNVSRLKTGKFVIEPSPVNLAKTVADEVSQLQETAKNRSLELKYEKPADFPTLMIDETKIRQVIMNFIDNAIYYTPSGGKIEIQLHDSPTTIELLVKDNGIGVPKREQPHLFTKFYRAGNARQTRPDGTGLGLFMAKKVIVAQGGAVIFESSEGKGSTFGFIFPKSRLVAQPAPQAVALHA